MLRRRTLSSEFLRCPQASCIILRTHTSHFCVASLPKLSPLWSRRPWPVDVWFVIEYPETMTIEMFGTTSGSTPFGSCVIPRFALILGLGGRGQMGVCMQITCALFTRLSSGLQLLLARE